MFFSMFDSAISLPIEDLGASNHPSSMVPIGNDTLYSLITSAAPSRPIILSFSEPQHLLISLISFHISSKNQHNRSGYGSSDSRQREVKRQSKKLSSTSNNHHDDDGYDNGQGQSKYDNQGIFLSSSNPNHTFFPTSSRLYLNQTLNRCSDKQTYFLL